MPHFAVFYVAERCLNDVLGLYKNLDWQLDVAQDRQTDRRLARFRLPTRHSMIHAEMIDDCMSPKSELNV